LTGGPFEGKIRELGLQGSSTTRRWDADASVVSARAKTFVNSGSPFPIPGFLFRVQVEIPRRECAMTANLRTLTKEKREVPMKRLLMPTTALAAMKKMAFTILCVALLMLVTAPAWADQCAGALPVGSATGCGALITVFTVDGTGNATAFIVTTVSGTGNPYDGTEDTLVGVQNNSGAALKSIHLSASDTTFGGIFGFDGDGPCQYAASNNENTGDCYPNPVIPGYTPSGYEGPDNTFTIDPGTSCGEDSICFTSGTVNFTTPIPNGGSTWFALEGGPQSFGTISQTQTLYPGVTAIFPAGNDNSKWTPFNNKGGEQLTITAVPILRSVFDLSPPSPGESCVPYADFSAANGVDTCVELQADCAQGTASSNDCATFLYQVTTNYDLPADQSAIGGPDFLVVHGVGCPQTSGFNHSIFLEYGVSRTDPHTTGGGGGLSCYVATFHPGAPLITSGTTSSFFGFEFPVSNTKLNPIFIPLPVWLSWDYSNSSSGNPVTNLNLCNNTTGLGCTAPWVNLGAIPIACPAGPATGPEVPISSVFNSGLLNFGRGEYSFVWNTAKGFKKGTCVKVVLTFDTGLTVFPARFQFY
jgi:hypothetical protein